MSHKATNWLAEIDPVKLGASEFRVLFHLCDCHNASQGCFPSQAYLRDRAGVSNGTVNNVLNSLEQKGLIQRHQSRDGKTKRQCPTRYILGFEMEKAQVPSPKSGDGKLPKPSPKSGDGAVSNSEADPSPISGPTRLQPTGEEPVSNQEITSACAREGRVSSNPMVVKKAERAVASYRDGRHDAFDEIERFVWDHVVSASLLTEPEFQAVTSRHAEKGKAP
ncbi:helix-turn-helix domain-containing protein [Roseovarius confluentis]|uniref:helix-turn-helix domain-containing protein n=1 Tax=Roseovarius confluentis TaxID=1852027 RepID=UPI003BAB62AD